MAAQHCQGQEQVAAMAEADGASAIAAVMATHPADESVQAALEKVCPTDDLVELFEMLDVDGSGSVDV